MKLTLTSTLLCLTLIGFSQTILSFEKNNFRVQYPNTWQLDTSRMMGTELFIFSPIEDSLDQFRENLNVLIQDLNGQNIDLERYKQITESQIANLANDNRVFESSIIKANKMEYFKTTYAMTQGKLRLIISSICFIQNNKAYLATFCAEADKIEQYKAIGDEILHSFRLAP